MCNCIDDVDNKLAPDQCINATMFGHPRRAVIDLIRKDKWVTENRRSKPKFLIATHCPMCGEKYEKETAPALSKVEA